MDGQLLAQIQKELKAFEDRQLWALFELAVAEMQDRGLLDPVSTKLPTGPDTQNRDDEP